jgi:hypothetical protein
LVDDLVAMESVGASAKRRIGEDLDEKLWVEPTLAEQGDDFAEHFQSCRGHHISKQLDEIGVRWIGWPASHAGLKPRTRSARSKDAEA